MFERVIQKAKDLWTNTGGFLNTLFEGFLGMMIGGALYVLTFLFTGQLLIVSEAIPNMPGCITEGMGTGIAMLLSGLQIMGMVFFVIGMVVVVRVVMSLYARPGGGGY
jgi:hypothetical protein